MSGDVILVAPGTHLATGPSGTSLYLKTGTSLLSEGGPNATFLVPDNSQATFGLFGVSDGCVVSGFTMTGHLNSTITVQGDGVEISNNIIDGAFGIASLTIYGASAFVHHNIFFGGPMSVSANNPNGFTELRNNIILNGVEAPCAGSVVLICNLLNGVSPGCGLVNNFSADPLFCGTGNYYLRSDSPCAPGNHPDGHNECGLIGPLPVGCGTVAVEEKTWGGVKAIFR
jgi:hypothetical protein